MMINILLIVGRLCVGGGRVAAALPAPSLRPVVIRSWEKGGGAPTRGRHSTISFPTTCIRATGVGIGVGVQLGIGVGILLLLLLLLLLFLPLFLHLFLLLFLA